MKSHNRKLRVLVVDDDTDTANVLSLLLEHHGYQCKPCSEAKNCLATLEEWSPDVLLLDLAMPGLSGFDIARELRMNCNLRPTLLIAVSGYGRECDRQKTKEAGFDYHLLKPVAVGDIQAVLRTELAGRLVGF